MEYWIENKRKWNKMYYIMENYGEDIPRIISKYKKDDLRELAAKVVGRILCSKNNVESLLYFQNIIIDAMKEKGYRIRAVGKYDFPNSFPKPEINLDSYRWNDIMVDERIEKLEERLAEIRKRINMI